MYSTFVTYIDRPLFFIPFALHRHCKILVCLAINSHIPVVIPVNKCVCIWVFGEYNFLVLSIKCVP